MTLPARAPHPQQRHNLAALPYGPTIRASSYFADKDAHHHPAFLIDGRARPTEVEKWASAPRDKKPWVEITWRGSKTLDSVVLTHAGKFERAELSASSYDVTCLRSDGRHQHQTIDENRSHVAEHALACADSVGIRVDFREYADACRVYEIEAWGQ